ncbi:hypothetical protein ACFYON_24550 [Micromonospora sp. NPDC005686]
MDLAYQPNRRFWAFQWIELALHLGAAGLLAAFGLWHVRRRAG